MEGIGPNMHPKKLESLLYTIEEESKLPLDQSLLSEVCRKMRMACLKNEQFSFNAIKTTYTEK
jgi:hypothetical protein